MRILVSNDDGIRSPGIAALSKCLEGLGEIWIVAPETEQSAASHSISLHRPLRIHKHDERAYAVDGTPSDCIYLAMNHLLRESRPDLVVSGINHGPNIADDVTYSGTVAAAIEATMLGVPAAAFSHTGRGKRDFTAAAKFARGLVEAMIKNRLPRGVLLNVNIPAESDGTAYRITRQGRRQFGQEVIEKQDPRGRRYYWIGGDELAHENIPGSDANAVYDEKIISVTPLHLNLTHDPTRQDLQSWDISGARSIS